MPAAPITSITLANLELETGIAGNKCVVQDSHNPAKTGKSGTLKMPL
jgi:hypothetical protein